MATHLNSFALLIDDEGNDVSTLIARAAAPAAATQVEDPAPADAKQKQKMKNGKGTKPLPRIDTVRSDSGRRRGGRDRELRRPTLGETEVKQFCNGGSDGYQQNNGGPEDSQWEFVGAIRYQRNNGGDSFRNYIDDNTWGHVRGRGPRYGGGSGGQGRSRVRGREFNENQGLGNNNQGFVGNNYLENTQQDDGLDDGWEKVNPYPSRNGSRYQRREYGGRDHGYRTQGGGLYGRHDGRNYDRGLRLNNSEMDESNGVMSHTLNGDNKNCNTEVSVPVSAEVDKDLEPEHAEPGVVVNLENHEKSMEKENAEKKTMTVENSGKKTKEEIQNIMEEVEKKQREEEAEKKRKEEEDEAKEMTLEEYEKLCLEKRKGLESLKNMERRVILDKDFESMQVIEKKKEDSHSTKKSENDKLKKKESLDKEEKARKAVSINEFLKPAEGEEYRRPAAGGRGRGRGRGRWENGGFRGGRGENGGSSGEGFSGRGGSSALHIQDDGQFPGLQATARA